MRTLLLLLIGICFAIPGMGQQKVVNVVYPERAKIDSLLFDADSIGTCQLVRTFIKGENDFDLCTFSRWANFSEAIFSQDAIFSNSTFSDLAYFNNTIFLKQSNFSNTTFSNQTGFFGAIFSEETDFSDATFSKQVDFSRATFSEVAYFNNATFLELPIFTGTQLPAILLFESTNLQNIKANIFLNLSQVDSLRRRSAISAGKCTIFLLHTDVSKLVLDYEKFSLGFGKTVSLDEKVGTYQQVIKKCKDMGMEVSAQGFDIDLQIMKLENRWGLAAPAFISFQRYWWNFGHDRSKILRNTLYAFLASFIIFLIGYRRFFAAYFPAEQLGIKPDYLFMPGFNSNWVRPTQRKTSALTDRFKITFFYTALIFFGWKMDHSKLKYRTYPWTAFLIYSIYIIGLIHLAYLAGFIFAR